MVRGLMNPRSRLVVVGLGCVLAMFALGLSLHGNGYPTRVDEWGWQHLNSSRLIGRFDVSILGGGSGLVGDVSPMGSASTGLAAGIGMALAHRWRGQQRLALLCLLSPVIALVLTDWVLKPLFDRHMGTALAYPSGQTVVTSAVGTVLTLLAYRRGGLRRAVIVAILALLPIAAGILFLLDARLHYPTDILGGMALGVGSALLFAAWLLPHERFGSD
jgi:membrane-associated phospholipid phosphatase